MIEEWKDVEGYEGYYQVSSKGRVKRLRRKVRCNKGFMIRPEKVLKPYLDRNTGYLRVTLSRDSKMKRVPIHRLMVKAFMTNLNAEIFTDTNHAGGDKTNNDLFNLELCTRSYNLKHAYKHELQPSRKGKNNGFHSKKHSEESKEKMSESSKGKRRAYNSDGTYRYV